MPISPFETRSTRMLPLYLLTTQAPTEDVARIMATVTGITPLTVGAYDSNAYVGSAGIERYRPREGAAVGTENNVRERPGVVEISFEIPREAGLLDRLVEAIFQVHSYQEPVIRVQELLGSRSKGLDDSANPNRWWNTTGDWKNKTENA